MNKRNALVLVVIFLSAINISRAQVELSYYLANNVTYNDAIPKPSEIIGHEVGEWHITHDKLVWYRRSLPKPDRISIKLVQPMRIDHNCYDNLQQSGH